MKMPGFNGMFFPMMMPPWMPPQPESPQPAPDLIVPARVRVALEFLSMLHQKQMKRGAVGEGTAVLELDGIELTTNEQGAEEAACEMLAAYFRGRLEHDAWEKLRHDHYKKKVEAGGHKEGTLIQCPTCNGNVGLNCLLCRGGGKVLMTPLFQSQVLKANGPDDLNLPPGIREVMEMVMGRSDSHKTEEKPEDPFEDNPEDEEKNE